MTPLERRKGARPESEGSSRPSAARPSAERPSATTPTSPFAPSGAPRVARVTHSGRHVTATIEPAALCKVFGVDDREVATRLLSQLVNILQPDPSKPVEAAVIDQALALVQSMGPVDVMEAMTATMLVAAQHAALDSMRRAMHPDQTPAGRALYEALALKGMRTFAQLLEALNHGRGKGVTQQIIVKHVSVEPGGQAVVGPVEVKRGRG